MKGYLRFCGSFRSGIVGVALFCLAVPAAIGLPITYVFSGPATGTLGATAFTGATVTVTGTTDTVNITAYQGIPTEPCITLTKVTINVSGVGSATATGPNIFAENTTLPAWGLLNGNCSLSTGDWLNQANPLAASYTLITALGPTTGTQFLGGSVATTAGTLTFSAVPLTFQATLGQASPIPTLSQWALLVLGSALTTLAAILIRRRTRTNR